MAKHLEPIAFSIEEKELKEVLRRELGEISDYNLDRIVEAISASFWIKKK